MSEYALSEEPTVAKINQKSVFVGTGAEILGIGATYPGQLAFCTSTGDGFTADKIYERNAADDAWIELGAVVGAHEDTHKDGGSDAIDSALLDAAIPSLNASKINAGTFAAARIPSLAASKITSGQFPLARLPRVASGQFLEGGGAGSDPIYNALVAGDIPNLNASKINAGTFADARIPSLAASKITSGTFAIARYLAVIKELTLTFIIDGGGAEIATGIHGDLEIPFACTINRVTMLADQSSSIVVDIWKDTYANFPPTNADSITASAVPTITTATKSQDSTLTGWTTSIAAGNILRFNVDSVTTITRLTISLKVTKT